MSEQDLQPVFSIEKIYVKDLSLEIPHAPQIFLEREQPEIDMQLATEGKQLEDGVFEAVITVTVTAKLGEKVMFLVEAAQAGIFQIRGVAEEEISGVLAVACPNILFPFAREAVSDAVARAGFQPIILQPVNFEGMYMQRLQQQAESGAPAPTEVPIQ